MIDNTIMAARAQGATVVLPGTVYNYGPDAFPVLDEAAPQHPITHKGAIRVELERRLRDACHDGGLRAIIVRAGDFFGPSVGNSWFSQALVKPGQAVKVVRLPGTAGIGHQWSYLPDVARTMVELLAHQASLPSFACFHMSGHWDADGTQMAAAICRVVQRNGGQVRLRAFPWWGVRLAAPFMPTLRELLEMRYLWRQPLRMDNTRLTDLLGQEPHTPLDEAVRTSLAGLGCLNTTSRGRGIRQL